MIKYLILPLIFVGLIAPVFAEYSITIPYVGDNLECEVDQNCFLPMQANVALGETVTWKNNDFDSHLITNLPGEDLGFNSDNVMERLQEFSYDFNQVGTFTYYCSFHPWEVGTVNVTDSSTSPAEFTVNTDKSNYVASEKLIISGTVSIILPNQPVWLIINNGTHSIQNTITYPNSDGTFEEITLVSHEAKAGELYFVHALYDLGQHVITSFNVIDDFN